MSDIELPCFLARPSGPVRGGIVVGHEGTGLNNHVLRFAEALAAEGYVAVAPDFFYRSGGPKEYENFWEPIKAATGEQLKTDLASAIALLRQHGATAIGATGFCMGGNMSYRAALWADDLGVDAAVGFYGSSIVDELGAPGCPFLLIYAGTDEWVSTDNIAAVQAHHPDNVVVYPDAWKRLLAFFGEHLSQG